MHSTTLQLPFDKLETCKMKCKRPHRTTLLVIKQTLKLDYQGDHKTQPLYSTSQKEQNCRKQNLLLYFFMVQLSFIENANKVQNII